MMLGGIGCRTEGEGEGSIETERVGRDRSERGGRG